MYHCTIRSKNFELPPALHFHAEEGEKIKYHKEALTAGDEELSRKKVRLLVELDPIRLELNSYDEPLVEMRDSL